VSDAAFDLLEGLLQLLDFLKEIVSCILINSAVNFVNESTNVLVSLVSGNTSGTVRVGTCALAAAFLGVQDLEDLKMKVTVAVGLIDDLSLYWTAIDVRVLIVDVRTKGLEVLIGLILVLLVLEHVAYLFEVVR
jgi:hypothetical protein